MEKRAFARKGFTLAEVLIVLGVIGIIAALTIPTLMAEWKSRADAVRVKKFYSTTAQAIELAKIKQGNLDRLDYSAAGTNTNGPQLLAWFNDTLGKQLKVMKTYNNAHAVYYTTADGTDVYLDDLARTFPNEHGVTVGPGGPILVFTLDLNGYKSYDLARDANEKPPRRFQFYLTDDRGLVPAGLDAPSMCDSAPNSMSCTARVLEEGKTGY